MADFEQYPPVAEPQTEAVVVTQPEVYAEPQPPTFRFPVVRATLTPERIEAVCLRMKELEKAASVNIKKGK